MLCATLSASLFVSKAAEASCGNGGGQPSNGCDSSTAAAATAQATASTNVGVWSSLRQDQAQLQAQQQVATGGAGGHGGNATASGGNASATGGSANAQGGVGYGGNANGGNASGGNASGGSVGDISLSTRNPRQPVSSAIAPSIAPTANCAIPVTGGVSFVGFSGSMGTATLDANCVFLEQVKAVAAMGDRQTALEMMCLNEEYRSTRERMGKPCLERNPKGVIE